MTNLPSSYTNSSIKLSIPQVLQIHRQWNEIHQILNKPHKNSKSHLSFFSTNFLINHTPNLNLELTNPAESNHQHTNNKRRKALINQNSPTQVQSTAERERRRLRRLSQTLSLSDSDLFRFFLLDLLLFFFLDWILMRFWAGLIRTISRTGLFFFFLLFYLLLLLLLFTIYYLF